MRTLKERTIQELAKDIHWSKKAVVINIYHNACLNVNPRWTYADTARDLGVSKAFVSENIKLASVMQNNAELIHMSRKRALFFMRNM